MHNFISTLQVLAYRASSSRELACSRQPGRWRRVVGACTAECEISRLKTVRRCRWWCNKSRWRRKRTVHDGRCLERRRAWTGAGSSSSIVKPTNRSCLPSFNMHLLGFFLRLRACTRTLYVHTCTKVGFVKFCVYLICIVCC